MIGNFQQEWQTGNQQAVFPFSDTTLASGNRPPQDFLLDLRLFLTGTNLVESYISRIAYSVSTDSYTLDFANVEDQQVVLTGTVPRLTDGGDPKVGVKQVIAQGEKVCLFLPGQSWHDHTWGGATNWTKTYSLADTRILSDVVNPGPSTFRRIFIEGHVPDESAWPRGGSQRIVGGYNIQFGGVRRRQVAVVDGAIDLNVVGGAGAGYYPQDKPRIDYVATLQGQGPNDRGNVTIEGLDCLRVFQPKTDAGPIPSTIQLASDCLPCCPCSEYRKVSRAIGRRSAKLRDLCDQLNSYVQTAQTAYNDGVAIINAKRRPLAIVRNVRALGSHLSFSVQNVTGLPLFAYITLRITASGYALGAVHSEQANVVEIDASPAPYYGNVQLAVLDHKATLPAMVHDVSENPLAGFPAANFPADVADILICVGQKTTLSDFAPIDPGGLVEVRLNFPSRSGASSVAAALPLFVFNTIAVYGATPSFACSAETYKVKIQASTVVPDDFEDCDTPFANDYTSVVVP